MALAMRFQFGVMLGGRIVKYLFHEGVDIGPQESSHCIRSVSKVREHGIDNVTCVI